MAIKSISYLEQLQGIVTRADKEELAIEDKLISYKWSYEAKEVGILLRDAVLRMLKLAQLTKDGIKSEYDNLAYRDQVLEVIHRATGSLVDSHEMLSSGKGMILDQWKHEMRPNTTIVQQLSILIDQLKQIQRSQHKLDRLDTKISNYRNSYHEFMQQRVTRLTGMNQELLELSGSDYLTEERMDEAAIRGLIAETEAVITKLDGNTPLSSYENISLEDTDRLMVPVATDAGQLVYKSIEVLSELSGWASFNLDTPLRSVDAKIHSYTEQVLAGLYQLLNRLKARLESTKQTGQKSDIVYPLKKVMSDYKSEVTTGTLDKLKELEKDIDTYLLTSQIWNEENNFLPSLTLEQVSNYADTNLIERRYDWKNITSVIDNWTSKIFSKYTDEEQLTAAGYINKVLSFDPESDVNALFLRKGFLGSSFTVERSQIMTKVRRHYELWKDGFGGSLLIHGGHGTGRTTVLEMLPLMYPDVISHHIIKGQKIDINGYQILVKSDIVNTLKEVIKYSINQRCIVTIDDIEQYARNPQETFELVNKLLKLLRKTNKKIYFAITMHRFLAEHLDNFFQIDNPFSEQISTDDMPFTLIKEAVATRAYAVSNHSELSGEGETIEKVARKVALRSRNNVGRAMQMWCMYHGEYDNDHGDTEFKQLVKRNEELLKLLFRNGAVYEPDLRSLLNSVDAAELKANINNLARIKLLVRPESGFIKINPYLQSTIEAIIS